MWAVGRGSPLAGERAGVNICSVHEEGGGEGYFFEHGVDIRVVLGSGAGFCPVGRKVREDFVVGEDGGLGFEDLHGWW